MSLMQFEGDFTWELVAPGSGQCFVDIFRVYSFVEGHKLIFKMKRRRLLEAWDLFSSFNSIVRNNHAGVSVMDFVVVDRNVKIFCRGVHLVS